MDNEEQEPIGPAVIEVESGKSYTWCGCGATKTPPLCDRTDCGDKCMVYVADLTEDLYFCNCKETKNPPWCDGSHAKILFEMIEKRKEAQ